MERVLKREAIAYSLGQCRIVPAALGEQIGDYAALSVAYGV
jgi:glucokinase